MHFYTETYVLLTLNEGIVYKRVHRKDAGTFTLISDNTFYEPYDVLHENIVEVWEFACSITLKELQPNFEKDNIVSMFSALQKGIDQIIIQTK